MKKRSATALFGFLLLATIGSVHSAFVGEPPAAVQLEHAARDIGLPVFSEIFADRGYLSSGQLVPRGQDGAMIHDPDEAAERLVRMLDTGLMPVIDGDPISLDAHSICVHGDSPTAVAMAREVRQQLVESGVKVGPFLTT